MGGSAKKDAEITHGEEEGGKTPNVAKLKQEKHDQPLERSST